MNWKKTVAALSAALSAAARADVAPAEDTALAGRVDLESVTRIALERNPDLREASERATAAVARAQASGRYPDLAIQAQLWQQPLSAPVNFSQANMVMVGLRQTFPAPGSLSSREEAGRADAAGARAGLASRRAEIVQQVRRAYAQYWLSEQEQLIHLEHMDLTDRIVQDARGYFTQGLMSKADFLRTTVELARVHAVLSDVAQQRRTSGALLNVLMARDPDAPLGPPNAMPLPELEQSVSELEARAGRKPEVEAAEDAVARSTAQLAAVRAESSWPEFMVGLDYGYMPVDGTSTYTAMIGFTLPWLSPRHGDERREATALLSAQEASLASARNQARFQVRDALARYRAARDTYDLVENQLLPQAREAAGASQDAFRHGQTESLGLLGALRELLDVRLELARARARVEESWADLARAAGEPRTALSTPTEGRHE
ncbi:MAG TPA: TolC family protein [Anaeromyxobacteraceae bacterium]|nr:TolC family protein [Anaeromyxobacteraceae bacterium]